MKMYRVPVTIRGTVVILAPSIREAKRKVDELLSGASIEVGRNVQDAVCTGIGGVNSVEEA